MEAFAHFGSTWDGSKVGKRTFWNRAVLKGLLLMKYWQPQYLWHLSGCGSPATCVWESGDGTEKLWKCDPLKGNEMEQRSSSFSSDIKWEKVIQATFENGDLV